LCYNLRAHISDTPPEELTTTAFAQECHNLFQNEPNVSIEEIVGDELREKGYGGIYNVGKGAVEEPRLVILTYDPKSTGNNGEADDDSDDEDCIALIGKGIVYDTGGLAIKSKTGMCGMKSDMGGAAGVRELTCHTCAF
jgi:probable aminopeptidase NPEPL1